MSSIRFANFLSKKFTRRILYDTISTKFIAPTHDETTGELDWWQTAAIYQIYTKSFQDSNGDGIGDLQGIISRLDHLKDTGITGLLLTSIYSSPQVDGGYDISNYTQVDPIFGSLEDFQELVSTAHEKDLKVILDFVPNHSSDEHIWFQNSVARVEPYTDYYVWHDGIRSNDSIIQPPNNWLSVFGGSAWTWNTQRQQYYLHQFHTRQPDLNFQNPNVVNEITNVLRFWLDQGVDGFRISSVAHLYEDVNFPDEPRNENADQSTLEIDYDYLRHIYTIDLNDTINIVYQWRTVVDQYSAQSGEETRILITDSSANLDIVSRYFGNQTHQGAHLPLNLALIANLTQQSLASDFINALNEWLTVLPEGYTSNWIFGTHDYGRIASRFGLNRVDGINMLHLLPGTAFIYMGEELALLDTEISFEDTQDPYAINAGQDRYHLFTRDPARTPYQWDNSTSAGFSTNVSTWLPVNENYLTRNLAIQIAAERSNFNTYKAILELRQSETIKHGDTQFLALSNDQILAFARVLENEAVFVVAINLRLLSINVDLSGFLNLPSEGIRVCLASSNAIVTTGTPVNITSVPLSANAAVVLCNTEVLEDTTTTTTTTTVPPEPETTASTTTSTATPTTSTTTTTTPVPETTTPTTTTTTTTTPVPETTTPTTSTTTTTTPVPETTTPTTTTTTTTTPVPETTTPTTSTTTTTTPLPETTTLTTTTTTTPVPETTTPTTTTTTTTTPVPETTTPTTNTTTTTTPVPETTTPTTNTTTTTTPVPETTTPTTSTTTTTTPVPETTTPTTTTTTTPVPDTTTPTTTITTTSVPETTTQTSTTTSTPVPETTTTTTTTEESEPEHDPEISDETSGATMIYISSLLAIISLSSSSFCI